MVMDGICNGIGICNYKRKRNRNGIGILMVVQRDDAVKLLIVDNKQCLQEFLQQGYNHPRVSQQTENRVGRELFIYLALFFTSIRVGRKLFIHLALFFYILMRRKLVFQLISCFCLNSRFIFSQSRLKSWQNSLGMSLPCYDSTSR